MEGVYFVKKLPFEIPREQSPSWLIVGDLATRSIDQLSCLVDEIFVPLLSNTDNHKGWPEMVAQDVQKHVRFLDLMDFYGFNVLINCFLLQTHSLKSTVYQVSFKLMFNEAINKSSFIPFKVQGQVSGRTILPMPVSYLKTFYGSLINLYRF